MTLLKAFLTPLWMTIFFVLPSTTAHAADTREKVLFLHMDGKSFDEVFGVMKKQLARKYAVDDLSLTASTTYEETKRKIIEATPKLVVAMDNLPLSYAIRYNAEQSAPKKRVRGVALMGLNLKAALKGNKEISGISFESPGYTIFTQFRYSLKKPLKKILVFYRKSLFQDTISLAVKQLANEGIELHAMNAESEGTDKEAIEQFVEKNLKKEAVSDKCDAVWVLLDSALLTPHLYRNVWVPVARDVKIPFVSGAEQFATSTADFATFVVTPNLADLGGQAVQQVESQLADQTPPSEIGIEELISVDKILNLKRAKKLDLELKEGAQKDIKTLE